MSLGSIAHMQYYFARTGLLDGKGGHLAKETARKSSSGSFDAVPEAITPPANELSVAPLSLYDGASSYAMSDPGHEASILESPTDIHPSMDAWPPGSEPAMLPPTVSTYKLKPQYSERLPDLPVLRRELKEALQDACKVIEESQKQIITDENDGFFEIQGLHILDIITLAIRAAKNYYTAHTHPFKLYAIRSEKLIRADLYQVLDILKCMASRNFRGGMKLTELTGVITWIESIDTLLKTEDQQEQRDAAEREAWAWRDGDWDGREREREWMFLKCFDEDAVPLPHWPESEAMSNLPKAFLLALQDGQRLVKLHNALVARSRRQYDQITKWHTDVLKPYRMAENLRYWIKAAELRWEIKLVVPVSDIVNNRSPEAWEQFEEAVFSWCRGVRQELTEEWSQRAESRRPPELRVDVPDTVVGAAV